MLVSMARVEPLTGALSSIGSWPYLQTSDKTETFANVNTALMRKKFYKIGPWFVDATQRIKIVLSKWPVMLEQRDMLMVVLKLCLHMQYKLFLLEKTTIRKYVRIAQTIRPLWVN